MSRGVEKKMDVRTSPRVDSAVVVYFWGSSEASRYPGSSDKSPGDWHSYPSRTQEAKGGPADIKVPRFRTGYLAFDGRDASLLPTPRVLNIYLTLWVNTLNHDAMTHPVEGYCQAWSSVPRHK